MDSGLWTSAPEIKRESSRVARLHLHSNYRLAWTGRRRVPSHLGSPHGQYITVAMQSPVQRLLLNASVLLFGRTIKYCVTNIGRKFPTSLSTLYYKTPVFPTGSTLQYHKSNTLALSKSLNWTLPLPCLLLV